MHQIKNSVPNTLFVSTPLFSLGRLLLGVILLSEHLVHGSADDGAGPLGRKLRHTVLDTVGPVPGGSFRFAQRKHGKLGVRLRVRDEHTALHQRGGVLVHLWGKESRLR